MQSQEYTGVTEKEILQWSSEIHHSLWETARICNASIYGPQYYKPQLKKGKQLHLQSTLSQKTTAIYIIYVVLHSPEDNTHIHQISGTCCCIQDLSTKLEETLPTH